ncbi:uncharacterized protein LOC119373605 isoform X2 [Rhipicephalus sanguineus]|uniref:uncharacterized protein LOC119373605 isoform X2 n=1 Tax=Rhipicephalus sanguineus TaxID=34632 RepID=UPI0018949C4F|nr:uncharacterized protein LOC119373605 isoform X2 [Rhipicephalus sanguineus]
MCEMQLVGSLTFLACLIMLECKRSLFGHHWNIKQFVNTTAPVWTYLTSEMTNIECKVDVYVLLTVESVEFLRSYYRSEEKFSYRLLAKFDSLRKKRMIISSPGGTLKQTEDIVYISRDLACAVVKITTPTNEHQPPHQCGHRRAWRLIGCGQKGTSTRRTPPSIKARFKR